jgi:hypothetical protein
VKPRIAVFALILALTGCEDPVRTVSDGALRTATANGAIAELHALGYRLARLHCRTPASNTAQLVRVRCDGLTTGHRAVTVDGIARNAASAHPAQWFTIEVAGRTVLRKPCLGLGCRDHG